MASFQHASRRQLRSTAVGATAAACCMAAAGVLTVQAFVAAPATRSIALRSSAPVQPEPVEPAPAAVASSGAGAGVVAGTWALAGALAAVASKAQRRSGLRRRAEPQESKEPQQEDDKKPFDVWDPSTYGNISMDDVKKYGAAGTLSYVITELLFWAIAFPTECFAYLQTAGHWPDFSKPEDSAAVFGLVFAASNVARLLLPIRFGAALAMAPWVDENIMQKFGKKEASEGA